MTGTVQKAVSEIKRGTRHPVYLLYGDELLAKDGAKAIVDALVPPEQQSLNVEVIAEDRDLASLPVRLGTLPLLGGSKVVVVHDSKAFVSKQNLGDLAKKSLQAWQAGDAERALRLFLQAVGAAGEAEGFLERAARGEVSDPEWERVLGMEETPEAEPWLREIAGRAVADGAAIPASAGAGLAQIYEDTIQRGIPGNASLVLTAEVVDQRRALFKKISVAGVVIDCGIRTGRTGETQMNPETARAKIREMVAAAGKTIAGDAVVSIVERTGFSMRALESEVEKILLYVGTRPAITPADVMEVLSNSRESSIFDLTNALSDRDAGRALRALRNLLAQREPLPPTLGMIAGEIRTLLIARGALERQLEGTMDPGITYGAFQSRVLPRLQRKVEGDDGSAAKLLEMHPFRAFNLLKGATRYSLAELVRALTAIHEADLALKSTGGPEDLLMERLLITILGGE
jgi:DNA polymerase-3 subunit delta